MNIEEIETPALVFNPKYTTVEFARDKGFLSVTTQSGLKKNVVIGNVVIDSSGTMYKTIGAKKKGNYYPFWKFEFFDPFIYIELEVEKVRDNFDFEELKDKVMKIVKRDKDEWANYGDVNEIKRSIENARTHGELIELIGAYVHPLRGK